MLGIYNRHQYNASHTPMDWFFFWLNVGYIYIDIYSSLKPELYLNDSIKELSSALAYLRKQWLYPLVWYGIFCFPEVFDVLQHS